LKVVTIKLFSQETLAELVVAESPASIPDCRAFMVTCLKLGFAVAQSIWSSTMERAVNLFFT
jgi:hypothetical protein